MWSLSHQIVEFDITISLCQYQLSGLSQLLGRQGLAHSLSPGLFSTAAVRESLWLLTVLLLVTIFDLHIHCSFKH